MVKDSKVEKKKSVCRTRWLGEKEMNTVSQTEVKDINMKRICNIRRWRRIN